MRVADETGDELPAAAFAHDEKFDLFVLCGLARTDSHRSRVLEPDSDQTKALRALRKGLPFSLDGSDTWRAPATTLVGRCAPRPHARHRRHKRSRS